MAARLLPILAACVLAVGQVATAASGGAGCEKRVVLTARLACFLTAAEAAGDPSICQNSDEGPVVFNCLAKYAEDTGDAMVCSRIPDWVDPNVRLLRESCTIGVAVLKHDFGACARVAYRPSRDSCYFMMVKRAGAAPEMCGRIESDVLRRACRQ